ncbi:hypothetical protein [Nocardia brasiliensis]|uniref:hypothetical protein n=1 Tax=Nocardia brasiliensis TaxID=37326 RepID=UPI003D8B5169
MLTTVWADEGAVMHRAKFVLPVLLLVLVGACTQGVPDRPQRGESAAAEVPSEIFGVKVPSGDRQKLDLAEQLRSIDPCGFFDQAKIATYGQISTLGPDMTISGCRIGFLQNDRQQLHSKVVVELEGTPPRSSGTTTKQIAGETVTIDPERAFDGDCAYQVPLRFPVESVGAQPNSDVVEVPAVAYAFVRTMGFTPVPFGCQVAEETVANIVIAFREQRIPRRDRPLVAVPLTERSPCELMSHLPPALHVLKLDAEVTPYECRFTVNLPEATGPRAGDLVRVTFAPTGAGAAMTPVAGYRLDQIAGKPVLTKRETFGLAPVCYAEWPVGPVVDGYRPGTPATDGAIKSARIQVMVKVSGNCAVTDSLVPSAIDLFGANR